MLDFLDRIRWDQTYDFLASGNPPIIVRLMLLNAVFTAIFAVRRAAGAKPMSIGMAFLMQCIVVAANAVVLYQTEVMAYLNSVFGRYFY